MPLDRVVPGLDQFLHFGLGQRSFFPRTFPQFDRSCPNIFQIHLAKGPGKVVDLTETHESITFRFVLDLVPDHTYLLQRRVVGEGITEHALIHFRSQITDK